MTKNDILVFVACAIVGAGSVIGTMIITALKIQKWITDEFGKHRKFVYQALDKRDRAIRRIEFHLVSQRGGFQPGVDPIEFGDGSGNGEAH